jgi:integrase/recombinase XerD
MTVSGLEQIMDRLGEWGHIKDVRCSPHTFRHTFAARWMKERGKGDIYKLARVLGHSAPGKSGVMVTERYIASLPDRF